MKRSIKRLPKRTQEELNVLLELIRHHVKGCEMVILYGSYARGGYVLYDERVEFGTRTTFQSDLDILIVLSTNNRVEDLLRRKVIVKYHNIFKHRRHASPQIIVEHINYLNKSLETSRYFYTDIAKEGIKLYDSGKYKLAKPRKLSYEEIKKIAVEEYETLFPFGSDFLDLGYTCFNKNRYVLGSFQLHQACERFYNAVSLVCTNYKPKNHNINELSSLVKEHSRELATVFPQNTDFEKHCYKLLCKAYIEARYNKFFVVTKEEYEYLLEKVEILKKVTERICTEKINSYDELIKQAKSDK